MLTSRLRNKKQLLFILYVTSYNPMQSKKVNVRHLVGVGLDGNDGHKRITRAEKFSVVGGSAETHEKITETVIKTFEDLKKKGKDLEETEPRELADLLQKHAP